MPFLSLSPATLFKAGEHHICVVLREVRFAKDSEPFAAVSLVFCCSRDVFVHVSDLYRLSLQNDMICLDSALQ